MKSIQKITMAGAAASLLLLAGCSGALGKLSALQEASGAATQGGNAWSKASTQGAESLKAKAELDTLLASQKQVVARIDAQKVRIDSLQALVTPPAVDAKAPAVPTAEMQAKQAAAKAQLDSAKAELAKDLETQVSLEARIQALKDKVTGDDMAGYKYGPPGMKGKATSAAVTTYSPKTASEFELPKGKYALVTFALNRQVLLNGPEDAQTKLGPGLLNRDTVAYWAPYRPAVDSLWSGFQAEMAKVFEGVELIDIASMQASSVYKQNGVYVPTKIFGISSTLEEYMAPGFGYYDISPAAKLQAVATDLGADYLIEFKYSGDYAIYDGQLDSAKAQLRLQLDVNILDKTGKLVKTITLDALSDNKGLLYDNEIYPESILWLSYETQPKLLEKLRSLRK